MTLDGLSALSPPHAPGEGLLFARCAERAVRKTGPASAPMRRKARKMAFAKKSACIENRDMLSYGHSFHGGIAQLVERLNGIQKVRSSTLLTSTIRKDD